jgi:hypothetical protein
LVAWGFTEDGERVLVSVMLGMRESHEDWLELGRDLIARGLGAPMLIVADGAPGLIKAIEQCWPASDRQHCCVHRVRNLLAKLPERDRERVRLAYWQALDDATDERDARQRLQALVDELDRAGYTAAARCLADDLDALVVHLRYPGRHRRRWRSTNLLERSLGEVKRRTKVIGRFPGETSCLTLVWAVLDLYITHTRPTASGSPSSSANASSGRSTKATKTRSLRRCPPHRLTTTGNLSRGGFTAAKGRHRASGARSLWWAWRKLAHLWSGALGPVDLQVRGLMGLGALVQAGVDLRAGAHGGRLSRSS